MLRFIILCTYFQLAVFRNIDKSYDREYERGLMQSDPSWVVPSPYHVIRDGEDNSEERDDDSTQTGDERPERIKDRLHIDTDYGKTRRQGEPQWVKDLLVAPIEENSSGDRFDMTRARKYKNKKEGDLSDMLITLAIILEGLNLNMSEEEDDDELMRRYISSGQFERKKREVSNDTSDKTVDDKKDDIKVVKESKAKIEKEIKVKKEEEKVDKTTKINDVSIENTNDIDAKGVARSAKENNVKEQSKEAVVEDKNTSVEKTAKEKSSKKEEVSSKETVIEEKKADSTDSKEDLLLRQLPTSHDDDDDDTANDEDVRRSYPEDVGEGMYPDPEPTEASKVKEKLLVYLEDLFFEIANKIQALTRVKLSLSPDNNYRIGYIVANIDTLQIKLRRLKTNMNINKDYWDDERVMEMFDQLRVTSAVVSSLIDTLTSYLPLPLI